MSDIKATNQQRFAVITNQSKYYIFMQSKKTGSEVSLPHILHIKN